MTNKKIIICCEGIWNSPDEAGVNELLHERVVKRNADGLFTYNSENVAYGLKNLPVELYS
ncbi:MAG: hypothetical protein KGZ88_10140 [Methylomicrobium sp.]|nr:hypothetical protein [Methylomicrobium sp.]